MVKEAALLALALTFILNKAGEILLPSLQQRVRAWWRQLGSKQQAMIIGILGIILAWRVSVNRDELCDTDGVKHLCDGASQGLQTFWAGLAFIKQAVVGIGVLWGANGGRPRAAAVGVIGVLMAASEATAYALTPQLANIGLLLAVAAVCAFALRALPRWWRKPSKAALAAFYHKVGSSEAKVRVATRLAWHCAGLNNDDAKVVTYLIAEVMASLTSINLRLNGIGEAGKALLCKAVEGRSGFKLLL
mmetsp:Transcript_32929/g.74470  ORF Transcript_32929/g.74470 Transcript_32929/m.74470 type:complete len:247 (-) Transcript_32929:146-886(-)